MKTTWLTLPRLVLPSLGLALAAAGPSFAEDPPLGMARATQAVLKPYDGKARVGLWVGGSAGAATYAAEADAVLPTASAIKTAILVELFAHHATALDHPVPKLAEVLQDDHPAIAHFNPKQRNEIRAGLAEVSIRRLGGIMMGSVPASNLVYNAAANVSIAVLGGPEAATKAIHARDAAFTPIVVRRYMLTDRKAHGDNEATTASLAAVLQRLAARTLVSVEPATIDAIRGAVIMAQDPHRGRTFRKDGDLATTPITCVRSGWRESPEGKPVVYVVMLALDQPPGQTAEAAHRDLAEASEKLAEILLEAKP